MRGRVSGAPHLREVGSAADRTRSPHDAMKVSDDADYSNQSDRAMRRHAARQAVLQLMFS
jgi:hypothetical protein